MGAEIEHSKGRLPDVKAGAASGNLTDNQTDFVNCRVDGGRDSVIAARMAALDPTVRKSIEELVDEADRGFQYLRNLRMESGDFQPHFWICGSARTIPPASEALARLAHTVVVDEKISTADAFSRCPAGLEEVNAAIKERNLEITLENKTRISQGKEPRPLLEPLESLEELRTELDGFREGIDSPRAFGSHDFTVGVRIGELLAEDGYGVITGGGPGQMMAGNLGAFSRGGSSVGISIKLPHEEAPNHYTPHQYKCEFFLVRKKMMLELSSAAPITGGGLGTIEEYFQILCAGMAAAFIPKGYWEKQLAAVERQLSRHGFDSSILRSHTFLTDSPRECVDFVKSHQLTRTTWSPEQIEKFKNSMRGDLVNAYHTLSQFNPAGAKVITLFAPDIPDSAHSPRQFMQSVIDLCAHHRKRGCKVMFAGHSDIAKALLQAAPEDPPLILQNRSQAGDADSRHPPVSFDDKDVMHHFIRSVSSSNVIFPGGLESPFRCFEMLCLLQNKKISHDKCNLVLAFPRGTSEYWPGIFSPTVEQASMKPYHAKSDVLFAKAAFQLKLGESAWVSGSRCIEVR